VSPNKYDSIIKKIEVGDELLDQQYKKSREQVSTCELEWQGMIWIIILEELTECLGAWSVVSEINVEPTWAPPI
jgi:hypothetical protein